MKRILLILILIIAGANLFAQNFSIVYFGRTEVNMEATKYIGKQIKKSKLSLKPSYAAGFAKLKDTTNPVVILNTGSSQGQVDSRITTYLNTVADKSNYILVNLYSMGKQTFYEVIPASDSLLGVDAVSAASYYKEGRTDTMHKQWTAKLFELIGDMAK